MPLVFMVPFVYGLLLEVRYGWFITLQHVSVITSTDKTILPYFF